MRKIRLGLPDPVPEHMLQIPKDQWDWVLPLLSGLLSEFPMDRKHALHSHPGWRENVVSEGYVGRCLERNAVAEGCVDVVEKPPSSSVHLWPYPPPSPLTCSPLLQQLWVYGQEHGLNPVQIVAVVSDHILNMGSTHADVLSMVSVVSFQLGNSVMCCHESFTGPRTMPLLPQPRLMKLIGLAVLAFSIDLMGSFGSGMADVLRLPRAVVPTSDETLWMHEATAFMWTYLSPRILDELTYKFRVFK